MMDVNAVLFITAQFGSRFANSFLTTAVRYELLEIGGVKKFASAQVATQVARCFMQQIAGLLTDNFPMKRLYVLGEFINLLLVGALLLISAYASSESASLALFIVNIGFGLAQAFTQPVAKSLPPAVVSPDDLAVVNSWDLTGDKIGRNLAPMVFTVLSSALGFMTAITLSFGLCLGLVCLKQMIKVADQVPDSRRGASSPTSSPSKSVLKRLLNVFKQVWEGILSLKSDRTIGLLILNTLVTNMLVYPLGSVVFPVIFKAIPEGSIEGEGSIFSRLILSIQDLVGIHKEKAWMNYAAVVSLGGVVGPFLSNVVVYWVKAFTSSRLELMNWVGLIVGIGGQTTALACLLMVLTYVQSLSAGMRIACLFIVWGGMTALNNVTTIYFNAHTQQRLPRSERGRFIANILALFTLANSIGSLMYGWALASAGLDLQIALSSRLLALALVLRLALGVTLRLDRSGRETVLLKKEE
eukprot:CAMPEP_0206463520 /NCGR_PEP_ID=MMETSP0324_2-20121206/26656_1 /ASSEMBLY_ACC=CAM_ASM_000836 /TAXON_ID=2866 /ORGANISM="Crypthecodinium cohnii, Strain Seligo" /LENGTH=469 /DNA_ID=CAMNT_0053935949 /DNA_START=84 /DNA_END=1493 /DNA_ORIENTATION=+